MCTMDNPGNTLGLTDKNATGCACGHDTSAASHPSDATATVTSEFLVSGMTCNHCVSSVTEELSDLADVADVRVDLNVGGASKVTVASRAALDRDAVRAAISEAGYDLVDATP